MKHCFYHSKDFDGLCSGAIVRHFVPDIAMHGIDYGEPFPWDIIKAGDTVFMVDFSLPPAEMEMLYNNTELRWIDHHKIAIDYMKDLYPNMYIKGVQDYEQGYSAAGLAWRYFTSQQPMPDGVKLISDYDVWRISPRVMEFQYGLRSVPPQDMQPDNTLWWNAFFVDMDIEKYITKGHIILTYVESTDAKMCASYSFAGKFLDLPALFINAGLTSSNTYKSVFDPAKHKICVSFVMAPSRSGVWASSANMKWAVSLRSFDDSINCGELARSLGGGGHVRAAGFTATDLSFIG